MGVQSGGCTPFGLDAPLAAILTIVVSCKRLDFSCSIDFRKLFSGFRDFLIARFGHEVLRSRLKECLKGKFSASARRQDKGFRRHQLTCHLFVPRRCPQLFTPASPVHLPNSNRHI